MAIWVGGAFIAFGVFIFVFKLYVSFETEGGAIGMVPTLDGAIFPPIFVTFGLWWMTRWHWAALLLIWLLTTLFAGTAIVWAGRLGEKAHRQP